MFWTVPSFTPTPSNKTSLGEPTLSSQAIIFIKILTSLLSEYRDWMFQKFPSFIPTQPKKTVQEPTPPHQPLLASGCPPLPVGWSGWMCCTWFPPSPGTARPGSQTTAQTGPSAVISDQMQATTWIRLGRHMRSISRQQIYISRHMQNWRPGRNLNQIENLWPEVLHTVHKLTHMPALFLQQRGGWVWNLLVYLGHLVFV